MTPSLILQALLLGCLLCTFPVRVFSQTLVERLGYPPGTKLLVVHADDLGETHSVNAAAIKALQGGTINSASMMVPCPWFPEIADYAKSHPDADFGLHLTLTSERVYYRWGPVAPTDKVPSLVDQNGYFPHEYKLPVFVPRDWFAAHPYLQASLGPSDIVLDHTVTIEPAIPPEKWAEFYVTALKNLKPGVTEFVIHPGYDDDELRAATRERSTWGSAWRQRDYDFFTSDQFREILAQQKIKLITWRALARAAEAK